MACDHTSAHLACGNVARCGYATARGDTSYEASPSGGTAEAAFSSIRTVYPRAILRFRREPRCAPGGGTLPLFLSASAPGIQVPGSRVRQARRTARRMSTAWWRKYSRRPCGFDVWDAGRKHKTGVSRVPDGTSRNRRPGRKAAAQRHFAWRTERRVGTVRRECDGKDVPKFICCGIEDH